MLYRAIMKGYGMRGAVSKYIYMMVTKDEYELPLCVGTPTEVAEYAGTTPTNVISQAWKGEHRKGFSQFVRVPK